MNLLLLEPSDFISGSVVRISGRRLRQLADVIRAEPGKRCKAGLLNGLTGTAELLSITPETAELSVAWNGEPPPKLARHPDRGAAAPQDISESPAHGDGHGDGTDDFHRELEGR